MPTNFNNCFKERERDQIDFRSCIFFFFLYSELHFHYPCLSQGIAFDKIPHGYLWKSILVFSDLIILVSTSKVWNVLSSQEHKVTQETWTPSLSALRFDVLFHNKRTPKSPLCSRYKDLLIALLWDFHRRTLHFDFVWSFCFLTFHWRFCFPLELNPFGITKFHLKAHSVR